MSEEILKCLNCEKPTCVNCLDYKNKPKESNKKRNKFFNLNNEKHTLKEWANILNIKYNTLTRRIRNGITIEEMEEAKKYIAKKNKKKIVKRNRCIA